MSLKIIRGFLSEEECKQLSEYAMSLYANGLLREFNSKRRFTTRFMLTSVNPHFLMPDFVKEIDEKICAIAGVKEYPRDLERGVYGINIAVSVNGGEIYLHTDPTGPNEEVTYRCNVITQKSTSGGELIYNGEKILLEPGDLHCYPASEIPHEVTDSFGEPRIIYMFSWLIPRKDWNLGKIKEQK